MYQNTIREIDAKIEIAYGNEETSSAIECKYSTKNDVTNELNFYNTNYITSKKAFTLENAGSGFSLESGRALIDPDLVGWWSTGAYFSGTNITSNGGYAFTPAPVMTMIFTDRPRPVRKWDMCGDTALGEYPVNFKIRFLRNEYGVLPENVAYIYTKTNNNQVQLSINLGQYYFDVRQVELTVYEWSHPGRMSKIYRFYDDMIETYGIGDLKDFSCIHEKTNNGEIKYGLCSDTCSVKILNRDRRFDRGYLKDFTQVNKRVMPYVNGKKLGTYFIKEWNIAQDDLFVECKGNDRLYDFQDIKYEGQMPASQGQTKSVWQLFKDVLDFANISYVKQFKYKIDSADFVDSNASVQQSYKRLSGIMIEPYLPKESVWKVLQMLCEASMSFVYVDNDDTIIVDTEISDKPGGETDSGVLISTSNAFDIKIPNFADMMANRVEIAYFKKTIKDEDLYTIDNVNANNIDVIIEFEDFVEPQTVEVELINSDPGTGNIFATNNKFQYRVIANGSVNIKKVVISGKKITFEKMSLAPVENQQYIKQTALNLYTYAEAKLIQTGALANTIGNRLIAIYKSGTRSAFTNWRGKEEVALNERFTIKDRFGTEAVYGITSIKHLIDGGYKQEIKGIKRA